MGIPSRIRVFVPSMRLETLSAVRLMPFSACKLASWDHKAGVGYIRPIRLDLTLGTRAILSGQGPSNCLPERSEQQRKHQLRPSCIYDS